jgi:hypothetical protein
MSVNGYQGQAEFLVRVVFSDVPYSSGQLL